MTGLGEFLRARRQERGLSQTAFAMEAGVSRTTVGDWEKNLVTPAAVTCYRIADALKVDVGYVLLLAGHRPSAEVLDPDERELQLRAEEFKAGLRGIPRPFWGPLVAAWSAAASTLRDSAVSAPDSAAVSEPTEHANGVVSAQRDDLSSCQQPVPEYERKALDAIVTSLMLDKVALAPPDPALLVNT